MRLYRAGTVWCGICFGLYSDGSNNNIKNNHAAAHHHLCVSALAGRLIARIWHIARTHLGWLIYGSSLRAHSGTNCILDNIPRIPRGANPSQKKIHCIYASSRPVNDMEMHFLVDVEHRRLLMFLFISMCDMCWYIDLMGVQKGILIICD